MQSCVPRAISIDQLVSESKSDLDIQDLISFVRGGKSVRGMPKSLSEFKKVFDELGVTSSGVVLRGSRIVIPEGLRKRVLELAHVGHQGVVKTMTLIRSRVWYPGIDKQVEEMMRKCLACQANVDRPKLEPMRPSSMPEGPWQEVSADHYGPLEDGTYWTVHHCDYSRFIFVDKIKSTSMDHVQPVLEKLFTMFGVPKVYKSDNGLNSSNPCAIHVARI